MKKYYDLKQKPKNFKVGNFVNLCLHRGYQFPVIKYIEIGPQLIGPFKITKRIGKLVYRLDLPTHIKIHDVISIIYLILNPRLTPMMIFIIDTGYQCQQSW